jgi:methionyl-tRNA formyltransferase
MLHLPRPWHDSIPSSPAAASPRSKFDQLADYLGRNHHWPDDFLPDNGLDTGPILLQKEVDILDTDTLGSLYFDKLYPLGVAALVEAVDLVRNGTAAKIPQDEAHATYEGWCKQEDVEIDWHKPLQEVWNLIRGADPQPGAWSTYKGQVVQIYDAKKLPGEPIGTPGEVVAVGAESFTVATQGGQIEVWRLRPADGAKMRAADFIKSTGLHTGVRFGS